MKWHVKLLYTWRTRGAVKAKNVAYPVVLLYPSFLPKQLVTCRVLSPT